MGRKFSQQPGSQQRRPGSEARVTHLCFTYVELQCVLASEGCSCSSACSMHLSQPPKYFGGVGLITLSHRHLDAPGVLDSPSAASAGLSSSWMSPVLATGEDMALGLQSHSPGPLTGVCMLSWPCALVAPRSSLPLVHRSLWAVLAPESHLAWGSAGASGACQEKGGLPGRLPQPCFRSLSPQQGDAAHAAPPQL